VINQYKGTLDRIADERDKAIFENLASREKMIAINRLKLEQEKFRSNVGFYPFDNNYNKHIEEMFNTMIENNFKETKNEINNPHTIPYNNIEIPLHVPNNKNPKKFAPFLSKEEERPISAMKIDIKR